MGSRRWNIGTEGEYRAADGLYVSGNFFQALGVGAQVGRLFSDGDDQKGCGTPGAVLTNGFWQSRYGGNPGVIGQSIMLDGQAFPIVGVTPPGFFGVEVGRSFEVAIPLCAEPLIRGAQSGMGKADFWFLDIMGRLKPGWTAERAQAQLVGISPAIFRATVPARYNVETAKIYTSFTFTATAAPTGVSGLRTAYQTQLWILLGATGLVLLITCANLANLMLARATAREREIAVRLAIGASRRRIIRQMFSESLLLGGFGALGGALLAQWLSQALVAFLSTDSRRLFVDLDPDWRVFLFIAGIAVTACLLFGLAPALKATGANPGKAMQAGGRSSSDTHERFALRRGLVVVQVALSLVLVVGALLFGRSLRNLTTLDPGFRQDGILTVNVDVRRSGLPQEALAQRFAEVMERVRTVPGVLSAAEAAIVPMSGSGWNNTIVIGGAKKEGIVNFNRVGVDYFRTMETRVLSGRIFGPEDRLGATESAIVNESFVNRYFAGKNPIGESFQIEASPGQPQPHYQIVGLVKDTKYTDLREDFTPIAYLAAAQESEYGPFLDLVLRSDIPAAIAAARAHSRSAGGGAELHGRLRDCPYLRARLTRDRATDGGALGLLRHPCDADRDHRPLRRDVVHGLAAQGGDRDPDGARRRSSQGCAYGDQRIGPAFAPGRADRQRSGGPVFALGGGTALRPQTLGSCVDCRCGGGPECREPVRRLGPCAPRLPSHADDCPERRMSDPGSLIANR